MARPSSKKRAKGGGRTANSEPRIQVFKSFNGMNFEHAPVDAMNSDWSHDPSQEDLVMTQMAFQNNVSVTNSMTLESMPDLIKMGIKFADEFTLTGPACLVGQYLFLAFKSNGAEGLGKVKVGGDGTMQRIAFTTNGWDAPPHITHIYWAQERLVVMDTNGHVWRSTAPTHVTEDDDPGSLINTVYGAITIDDPSSISLDAQVTTHGSLKISVTYDQDNYPYRVSIAYCIDTMFGPTKVSKPTVFYTNIEVAEWNESNYMSVSIVIDPELVSEFGATAASLYYTVDDAYELQFAQRAGFGNPTIVHGMPACVSLIDWYGYLTDTTMWTIANLDAPTKNYTGGPIAQYCVMIDGRLYFWGGSATGSVATDDTAPDYRIIIGGNPGNLFSSSPATGGGFVDIEPGTGKYVNSIVKYKTQSGSNIVTALCGSRQSQEELRYNLVSSTVSLSQDNSTNSWTAEHVSGSVGCRGPMGALVCEDGLYTVNRYGLALTTMTMEYNSQIRTTYVSDPIKPVFLADDLSNDMVEYLIHCDGIIYYGKSSKLPEDVDDWSVVFCYDVNTKSWWSLTIPSCSYNAIHMDSKKHAEGIGFICSDDVYVLPTTNQTQDYGSKVELAKIIESAKLSTTQPNHGYHHLTQLEFDFDRFVGTMDIELVGIDIFGRKVHVTKTISEETIAYGLETYMRIDMKLKEYKIKITAHQDCEFRLICFIAKLYVMPSRIGIVWGFDDKKSYRQSGDIQQTFNCYNDIVEAVIT